MEGLAEKMLKEDCQYHKFIKVSIMKGLSPYQIPISFPISFIYVITTRDKVCVLSTKYCEGFCGCRSEREHQTGYILNSA